MRKETLEALEALIAAEKSAKPSEKWTGSKICERWKAAKVAYCSVRDGLFERFEGIVKEVEDCSTQRIGGSVKVGDVTFWTGRLSTSAIVFPGNDWIFVDKSCPVSLSVLTARIAVLGRITNDQIRTAVLNKLNS